MVINIKSTWISGVIPEKANIELDNGIVRYQEDGITKELPYRVLSVNDLLSFYQASIKPITYLIIAYAILAIIILVTRYIQNVTFTASSMRLTLDMRKSAFKS